MNTDEEMLGLAAKAANYNIEFKEIRSGFVGKFKEIKYKSKRVAIIGCTNWNPLENDGDAFRLQVDIGLAVGICYETMTIEVIFSDNTDCITEDFGMDDDIRQIVRRAIVRAAAEIGKQ